MLADPARAAAIARARRERRDARGRARGGRAHVPRDRREHELDVPRGADRDRQRLFRRLFQRIEARGLEKVAEHARKHPVVLVPSHRSYFDFLILSWLFYANYLVPPHIAARENMAFGPFGFLFRRAGAFFMRRSFDDPLYKEVFRAYVITW